MIVEEYKTNTEALIEPNKRFAPSEHVMAQLQQQLQQQLRVNSNHSIMELYSSRRVLVVINPHGGTNCAKQVRTAVHANP